MKTLRLYVLLITFALFDFASYTQDYHVRIACTGNSITQGVGLSDPSTQSYPAQLAAKLQEVYGDTCIVQNFGVSGRTMLKDGDFPIWNEALFRNSLNFAPDICFILLGTNDSKPQNWDVYGSEFYSDYISMIDTFKSRNPYTLFMIAYPPPAYDVVFDIRDTIIHNDIIPVIDSVLAHTDAELVDFYNPLVDSAYLFPDKIHPGIRGSEVMAELIRSRLIETDLVHHVFRYGTFRKGYKKQLN